MIETIKCIKLPVITPPASNDSVGWRIMFKVCSSALSKVLLVMTIAYINFSSPGLTKSDQILVLCVCVGACMGACSCVFSGYEAFRYKLATDNWHARSFVADTKAGVLPGIVVSMWAWGVTKYAVVVSKLSGPLLSS